MTAFAEKVENPLINLWLSMVTYDKWFSPILDPTVILWLETWNFEAIDKTTDVVQLTRSAYGMRERERERERDAMPEIPL